MHSIVKILCKLLSIRLAPFLPQIVPFQSAFIHTRSIQYNFLNVIDSVRMLHKNKEASLMIKHVDSLSRGYMFELMHV